MAGCVPEISVIVPIYNSEKYLKACLDSLAVQTMENLEVLLIDDGSVDSSRQICEMYCERYSCFHYYYKENGGLSDARNFGLERLRGKYIAFVDSDDYVEPDFLQAMWEQAKKDEVQIVCCGYFREQRDRKAIGCPTAGRISGGDFWSNILEGEEIGNFMCNKLFEAELFSAIRFPYGKKYEDMRTLYKTVGRASGISIVPLPLYHYVLREQSITGSFSRDSAKELLAAGDEVYQYVMEAYPELEKQCRRYRQSQRIIAVNALSKAGIFCGDDLWDESRDYILTHWKDLKGIQKKFLLSAWMIRLVPALYGRLQFERKRLK